MSDSQTLDKPDVLTVGDIARENRISIGTVYAAVARGELPAVRFGRAIRFRRASIEAWLARSEGAQA